MGQDFLSSLYLTNIYSSIASLQHPLGPVVTLKMETVLFSKLSEQTFTTWCVNPQNMALI